MDLYIFDRELNYQGLLDSYFSLRWVRRYHEAGEFELHCALTPAVLELLQRGNVIWKKDDLEAGYIEYRQLEQDRQGQEKLIVKGKFLTSYLGRRIIWGREIIDDTVEAAMRQLVSGNCISPDNPDRVVPMLALGSLKGYEQPVNYQTSYKNVLEELEKLSALSDIGYRVLIDVRDKVLTFDIYQGRDLTAGQSVNPPAIFAAEFENVFEQQFIDSLNNYRNLALVAGDGEGQDRQLVTVGSGVGLDRHELFVDARDLQSETQGGGQSTPISPEKYQAMLTDRGRAKLTEHAVLQTFESEISAHGNLRYKGDFDLGDIVTVLNKRWSARVDVRITEIEEVYEAGDLKINCVFGNAPPTIIDRIRQVVD